LSVGDAGKVFSGKEEEATMCKLYLAHMKKQYSI
jgi:hypothetical protein